MTASSPKAAGEQLVGLIGANPAQLKSIRRILRAVCDGKCELAAVDSFSPDDFDLLLVSDYDALEPEARDRIVDLFSSADAARRARLLVICGNGDKDELARLFSRRALTNLLAKNSEVNAAELIVTVQKILRRDVFGLDKYFPWGIDAISAQVHTSDDRAPVLAAIRTYVEGLGVNSRLAGQFCTVADELMTNALYNAPRDADGHSRYGHLARTEKIRLEPNETVEIRYCCDGNRLGIAASDPFGSLTEERLLDYLGKCLRRGDDQVDTKQGGAGLGLYYIFEAVSHLVVNIEPGRRTEIIGLIDVHGSYRDFARANKSFNIFLA